MPYEVTCPSCQVRLTIKDNADAASFICPRCLKAVPHPANARQPAATDAPPPTAPFGRKRTVPTVEADAQSATWLGYFLVMGLVVLAMVGIVVRESMAGPLMRGDVEAEFRGPCCCVGLMMVTLPCLILYPIIRTWHGASASWSPMKNLIIILGLLILLPFAVYTILAIVCSAV